MGLDIVRSDSGLGHTREMNDTFFVLVGIRGNLEAARRRVMGSWSRGGGRRLCRGEVGERSTVGDVDWQEGDAALLVTLRRFAL